MTIGALVWCMPYPILPALTSLSPNLGDTRAGTTTDYTPIVLTGLNFTGATSVKFGITDATSFTVNSNTQITAVAPTQPGGVYVGVTVNVTVTTPSGTSNGVSYEYWNPEVDHLPWPAGLTVWMDAGVSSNAPAYTNTGGSGTWGSRVAPGNASMGSGYGPDVSPAGVPKFVRANGDFLMWNTTFDQRGWNSIIGTASTVDATVALLINITSFPSAGEIDVIVSDNNAAGPYGALYLDETGLLSFTYVSASGTTSTSVVTTTGRHLILLRRVGGQIQIKLDDAAWSAPVSVSDMLTSNWPTDGQIYLGANPFNSYQYKLDARILTFVASKTAWDATYIDKLSRWALAKHP